jgi:hypothetical protein
MKIFISWSGRKSNMIAESLKDWLEQVIQSTEPWISTSIDKGRKWSKDISDRLEDSKIGIICLTRENLNAPWILFEAGAISKTSDSYVCTFLTDISSPSEISGPLSSFQATKFSKEDVLKLCKTINNRVKDSKGGKSLNEKALEDVFETFYPKLEKKLNEILISESDNVDDNIEHIRSDRELLEETIEGIRHLKEKINDVWTNKEISNIVEEYVIKYTNQKSINEYDIIDEPHLTDFTKKLSDNPLIRKIFPNGKEFQKYLKDIYNVPF